MLLPVAALANGGGYFRGGVEQTGDLAGFEPEETGKVRILDEQLTIVLGKEEAAVEVRYLMHNETNGRVKVRFGFPVEESFDSILGQLEPKTLKVLSRYQGYEVQAAGKAVKAVWQGEEKQTVDPRFHGLTGWWISDLDFKPGEEKPVRIAFRAGYSSDYRSVSDTATTSAALLRYRLSTAACWADTIKQGRIVLKPDGIHPDELRVIKPVNRFRRDGDHWVWDFEDLEPTLADDIEIEARPEIYSHAYLRENQSISGFRAYVERGSQWLMEHSNYDVRASSTLAADASQSYGADQVKDPYKNAVWCEGADGPGIGEWLELVPKVAKPLHSIVFMGGYQAGALFQANARPKRMEVELNGEHRFEVEVPDKAEALEIPVAGYLKPVRKIRFTFKEVYPGTRFEDMCVSGIALRAMLDKKPELSPVR